MVLVVGFFHDFLVLVMNNFSSAKKRKKQRRGWKLRVAELLSIFFAIASPFFTLTLPDFFTPPFARRRWVGPVSLDLALCGNATTLTAPRRGALSVTSDKRNAVKRSLRWGCT